MFFLRLIKRHKNFYSNKIDKKLDALLLDTNCLLHPQCFKILAENKNTNNYERLEQKMINQCIIYV